MPQKLCLSRESFPKVLGPLGFVPETPEELEAEEPLPLLVEALSLLLFS
jgi:hypothetical protein